MLEHAQVCLECGRRPESDSPVCPCGHRFSTVPVELAITLQKMVTVPKIPNILSQKSPACASW